MTARDPRHCGVIPPVVTPLTADGEIDRPSLERVVGHLLDGGVSGLFALGSSGETAYLTPGQQDEVIEVITAAAAGQVPVLVRLVALFDIVRAARPGTVSATAAGLGAFKTALILRWLITTNVMSPPMRRLDAAETETIAACLDRAGLSRV
ncbi:dihydrodipicolinate synthase family protein [Streptomyces atratus]|uniref:dihydrodipicolinate synthase family protein n=1 Tax=Streptomyces atratus TaxID=1893 RepID=UPI0036680AB5